jgi:hypothetical protein
MSLHTVRDPEALVTLLHDLNERGVWPSVAFMDAGGVTGVAYGIDRGDEMDTACFIEPGEDRTHENSTGDDLSYIDPFERNLDQLRGPIVVLYPNRSE